MGTLAYERQLDSRPRRDDDLCRGRSAQADWRSYPIACERDAYVPSQRSVTLSSSSTRLNTRTGRAEERVAKLVDSPDRPESEASYKLDEGGWMDV